MTERRAKGFEPWLNRNHVVSRLVLAGAMLQLLWVTLWSMNFAYLTKIADGLGIAAVQTAVQAPVALFAAWVFKVYFDILRTEQQDEERRTTIYKHESTSTSTTAGDPDKV